VWAKGFRNPFRFTIRPNGLPAVGDVGWGSWEELNLAQAGRNYGWPCYEGRSRPGGYSGFATCKDFYSKEGTSAGVTFPDHLYGHGSGASIIGGPTYTGGPYPDEFDGDIIFGDYVQGFIKRLELDASGKPTGTKDFVTGWFGVDIELWNGELYYVNFGDGGRGSGSVVRVAYSPNNSTPIAVATATPTFGPSPLKVTFKGSGSSDPDGDALKYEWDFGDGTAKSTSKDPPVHTYNNGGNFDARLKVTDSRGASATATVRISVNNAPPVVTLAAPLDGAKYRDGVPVQLSGSATDPNDGTLAGARLAWNVVLVHGTHVHPFQAVTGKTGSFTPTTDHDADSFYRVTLTATDSDGLSASKTAVIRPEAVSLSIASTPAGAPINYAGYPLVAAPHKAPAAIGFRTSVAAAQRFVANGRAYEFAGWSDGGAIAHDITIPAGDLALVAQYRDAGPVVTGVGGFGPGPDKTGPRIVLTRANARRLLGKVSDPSGVKRVAVALRARKRRGGCRWWSAKAARLVHKGGDCSKPRWMRAVLRAPGAGESRWRLVLNGRLPKGRYTLAFRGVDGAGNVSTALAAGSGALRIGK
jgi:PKD repeat protein